MNPDHIVAMQLMAHALSTDAPVEDVTISDGTKVRIRKRPTEGISLQIDTLHASSASPLLLVYEPSVEPPPNYPPELPFIAGKQVAVISGSDRDRSALSWWGIPDAMAVADELESQLVRDGWVRVESLEIPGYPENRHAMLRRGAAERDIVATALPQGGTVMLIAVSAPDAAP